MMLSGKMYSKAICVRKSDRLEVKSEMCHKSSRPTTQTAACNIQTCPVRWRVGIWSLCSVTCGKGVRRRAVTCSNQQQETSNSYWRRRYQTFKHRAHKHENQVLKEGLCPQDKKPKEIQECLRLPCPPHWLADSWSQVCVFVHFVLESKKNINKPHYGWFSIRFFYILYNSTRFII